MKTNNIYMFLAWLIFVLVMMYFNYTPDKCQDNLDNLEAESFAGIILEVEKNRKSWSSSESILLKNGRKYAWEDDILAQPLFSLLSKGDSVHKASGTLNLKIIKSDTTIIFDLAWDCKK